jgi:alanine dehydrogenase
MLIGVPKEIKDHEYRSASTPSGVRELISSGHQVLVQKDLGEGIGFLDADYREAGAKIANSAEEVYEKSQMILKVKEPQKAECEMCSA